MLQSRWSTLTLLTLLMCVGAAGFWSGHHLGRQRETRLLGEIQALQRRRSDATAALAATPPSRQVEPTDPGRWSERWTELQNAPATPAREKSLADAVEELARRDGPAATALAAKTPNLRLRAALLRAAVKGWSATDAVGAIAWAESQTVLDVHQAVAFALQGAAENPVSAVRLTTALVAQEPARALEYGNDLISALAERGEFGRAAEFAGQGKGETAEAWLLTAYSRWAEFEPDRAMAAATQLSDQTTRDAAIGAIIVGWAPTNPKSLIDFAERSLSGEQQRAAVSRALEFWAESEPVAAATWINRALPGNVADSGIATLARSSAFTGYPEAAANWAITISNPSLRSDTVAEIIEKWAAADPARAEAFIARSPNLLPEDRRTLLERVAALAALR